MNDDKIKELIVSYKDWIQRTEDNYASNSKEEGEKLKHKGILDFEYLKRIDDDEYIRVFKDYLKILSGPVSIKFGRRRIIETKNEYLTNLEYLLTSTESPIDRAINLLDGRRRIKDYSIAFWTPLFNVLFPKELPNFNNKTIRFFTKLGINLTTSKLSLGQKYAQVANAFKKWNELDPSLDFYKLDHLMHYGTSVKEGEEKVRELLDIPQTSQGVQESFYEFIVKFITQAKTTDMKTSSYPKKFLDCSVNVSFGMGNQTFVPWITFLFGKNKTSDGLFPVFLYFKKNNLLILSYGRSVENKPGEDWPTEQSKKTINEYFQENNLGEPDKYGDSFVYKVYSPKELQKEQIDSDLSYIINHYKGLYQADKPISHIMPKNKILYGPPGCGKTYKTINEALNIIHNDMDYCTDKKRIDLIKEFNELKVSGQISFITFHQSYSYEEFMEGIRPVLDSENLRYELKDGVFKRIANLAESESIVSTIPLNEDINKVNFFKMSLGDTQNVEDDNIYTYCIDNNFIAMGWGGDTDFSDIANKNYQYGSEDFKKNWEKIDELLKRNRTEIDTSKFEKQVIECFANYMKKGDIVFISDGNRKIRAVAKIVGEYEYRNDENIRFNQFRKVEWLLKDVSIPVEKISTKNLSQMTLYHLDKRNLKIDAIQEIIGDKKTSEAKNYVLIIDEINRGNISKIFGELITLIEEDKRLGAKNQMTVNLPYSNKIFGVPSNLFIVGTMNTADRSIALLDVALRRRFSFEEMTPQTTLLKDLIINGLEVKSVLEKLNQRIEAMIDRDHMIGHSYFLKIKEESDQKLALYNTWYNDIIPLLVEYFYGDWTKLKILLGNYNDGIGFVETFNQEEIKQRFANDGDSEEYMDVMIGKIHEYNQDKLLVALTDFIK